MSTEHKPQITHVPVSLDKDEWWPVWQLGNPGDGIWDIAVPIELRDRYEAAEKEWFSVQDILAALAEEQR